MRAHRCGWVHVDIKPSNILIDGSGLLYLIDWGGARRIGECAPPGTLGYAPPWAWTGEHAAHPRDDYYSIAATLWELIHRRGNAAGLDRARTIEAQQVQVFEHDAATPPTVRQIFRSASAGQDLAQQTRGSIEAGDLRVCALVAGARMLRARVVAGGGRVAACAVRQDAHVTVPLAVTQYDVPSAMEALLRELRLNHALNARRWLDVLARCKSRDKLSTERGGSQVDRLRDRCVLLEMEIRQLLSRLRQPVVLIRDEDLAGDTLPVWNRLIATDSGIDDNASRNWTSVNIECIDAPRDTPIALDVAEEVLGTSSLGTPLSEFL